MQNDFEKAVKEKLNELNFVPSEPVWSEIESQIRPEKERKRRLLWLPLLFLLMCAGGYVWYQQSEKAAGSQPSKDISSSKPDQIPGAVESETSFPIEQYKGAAPNQNNEGEKENIGSILNQHTAGEPVVSIASGKMKEKSLDENLKGKKEQHDHLNFSIQPLNKEKNVSGRLNNSATLSDDLSQPFKKETVTEEIRVDKTPVNTFQNFNNDQEKIPAKETSNNEPDSTTIKKPELKQEKKKWQLAVVAYGGPAGMGKPGDSRKKDLNSPVSSPPAPQTSADLLAKNANPEGFNLAAGLSLKKQVGNRISFSTGLQYQFHQHEILVGKDTVVVPSVGNQFTGNISGGPKPYSNRYHFISLPLILEWQVLKNIPLRIEGGVNVSRLISTNAVIFHQNNNIYQEDKGAFRKTQFLSTLGLNYSFKLSKGYFRVGPQLQYGMGSLQKNKNDQHLYSYGLKTEFIF